jgi:prevent-host-death family protein
MSAPVLETVGSEEARQQLPALLERARNGKATVVTRHGKPCAAIVPVAHMEQAVPIRGPTLAALRGSGSGLWGNDVARAIADARDEWVE